MQATGLAKPLRTIIQQLLNSLGRGGIANRRWWRGYVGWRFTVAVGKLKLDIAREVLEQLEPTVVVCAGCEQLLERG